MKNDAACEQADFLSITSRLTCAFVSHNKLHTDEIPALLNTFYTTLAQLNAGNAPTHRKPAVPISKSVRNDYIVCLEDGKKLRMLKRYLRTHYQLTPEQYRHKWGLPADYPMTAPAYSKLRAAHAKK